MTQRIALLILVLCFVGACSPGPVPQRLDGENSSYPVERYLLGVGRGDSERAAEENARAAIAMKFSSVPWAGEVMESGNLRVALEQMKEGLLRQSRIVGTWRKEGDGSFHSLAVLERRAAGAGLRARIEEMDRRVGKVISEAGSSEEALQRLSLYLDVRDRLALRNALATFLEIILPGQKLSPPFTREQVMSGIRQAAGGIRIGVKIEGDSGGIVEREVVRSLAALGIALGPSFDRDLLIRADIERRADGGEGWRWLHAAARVALLDGDGRLLDTIEAHVKEGGHPEMNIEIGALKRLARKISRSVLAELEAVQQRSSERKRPPRSAGASG